jgi:simple sugar transport system permease protein
MRLELVRRTQPSRRMALLSPLIAVALTVVTAFFLFMLYGVDPFRGVYIYFVEPLEGLYSLYVHVRHWTLSAQVISNDMWQATELVVKATPLVLIGAGLAVAYLSNNWNIGAEGQFIIGAVAGSAIPVLLPEFQNFATLPLMLVLGALGGAAYAMIPALLKTRFSTNEILTSLMLVYAASLFLDWMVRGPWRDPRAFGFPNTITFPDAAMIPFFGTGRLNASAIIAIVMVLALAFVFGRTLKGFEIRVLGESPRAGAFAGFSAKRMTIFAFAVSGALAGLAGIMEVASVIGKLQPVISPGYGFTAIIVAFLGRLNPIGILIAGFVVALSYLGGEAIQTVLQLPSKVAQVLQGALLFYVLACDSLILYRIRAVRTDAPRGAAADA